MSAWSLEAGTSLQLTDSKGMGILVYNSQDGGGVGSTNNLQEHSHEFSFRASRMEWDSLDNRSFSLVEDPF